MRLFPPSSLLLRVDAKSPEKTSEAEAEHRVYGHFTEKKREKGAMSSRAQ